MNVTEMIAIEIPSIILKVNGSPNIRVPTRIAVIGSNTPRTEAFVAPILRVATANVAVEMIVGSIARPIRLSQSDVAHIPERIGVPDRMTFIRNTNTPVDNA